jgi:hypothetical protein
LLFRLLVVAEAHVPTYSPKLVDPQSGPVTLILKANDLDRRDPELMLRGRVLDEHGMAVAGAAVTPFGIKKGNLSQFGALRGVDALAITNDKGEFRLGVVEKGTYIYIHVSARSLAPRRLAPLATGRQLHDLTLVSGVTVTGKVVKNGSPVAGIGLGLVHRDRNTEHFLGDFEIGTDAEGHFSFLNVPPDQEYSIYGRMDSCRPHGAIRASTVRVGVNGTSTDVGTLTVEPGHRLSGRIVLADDKPLPQGLRVVLGREEAWDTQTVMVAGDGRFTFTELPSERYRLSINVPGYRVSPNNRSYDLLYGLRLVGTIDTDIDGLRFLLEPGPRIPPDNTKFGKEDYAEHRRRRDSPLQGAPDLDGRK